MAISTRKQIRDHCILTTKQDASQIGDLVYDFITLTLQEINSPAWALKGHNHLWSWLKRKTTFATVSGTADYVMERDVDKIALMRQTTTPTKIDPMRDEDFFYYVPNPTQSGNPRIYRMWEIEGISTRLAAADEVDLVSSSASDGSSFTASVTGYVSGRLHSESYTLNGTTAVSGTTTFDARELFVGKSGVTTGNVTFRRQADASTLVVLGPQEVTARFKIVTLYPTPASAITINIEYYKRIKELVNDADTPEFDSKFHYVVSLGVIAKIQRYLGKMTDFAAMQGMYKESVMGMVQADTVEPDLIEYLRRRTTTPLAQVSRSETNPAP